MRGNFKRRRQSVGGRMGDRGIIKQAGLNEGDDVRAV